MDAMKHNIYIRLGTKLNVSEVENLSKSPNALRTLGSLLWAVECHWRGLKVEVSVLEDVERSGKGGVCSCRAFNLVSKSFSSAHIQHDRYFFYDRFLTAFNPQRTTSSLKCPVMRASAIGPLMPLLCRITYLVSCRRTVFQASLC